VQSANKATCKTPICQPGAHCDGQIRIACSDDGQHILGTFDCAKEGLGCQNGKCVFVPPPPPDLTPQLVLGPAPLTFDGVKPGQSQERTLLVHNAGTAPLVVSKLWFDKVSAGQFAFAPQISGATSTPPEPAEIAPGDTLTFDLALTLNTATTAPITAELHAASNDPDQPELVVPLTALPGKGGCVVTFASEVHDFGLIAYGSKKTLPIAVQNTGTASCKFLGVSTSPCQFVNQWGIGAACLQFGPSACAALAPSTPMQVLAPGDKSTIQVEFSAPPLTVANSSPGLVTLQGLLMLSFVEAFSDFDRQFPDVLARGWSGWTSSPALYFQPTLIGTVSAAGP